MKGRPTETNDGGPRLAEMIARPLEWIGFLAEPAASQLAASHARYAPGYDIAREALVLSNRAEEWLELASPLTWPQVIAAGVFVKLRNDYVATIILLLAGLVRPAEAMSRVLLEGNVKLALLEQDGEATIAQFAKEHYRDAKIALERLGVYKLFDDEADEAEIRARIEELKPLAAERIPIAKLFQDVNAERVYDTMYRGASNAVHTTLRTIDERICWNPNGDRIDAIRTGPDHHEQPTTLVAATSQFIRTLGMVASILGVSVNDAEAAVRPAGSLEPGVVPATPYDAARSGCSRRGFQLCGG